MRPVFCELRQGSGRLYGLYAETVDTITNSNISILCQPVFFPKTPAAARVSSTRLPLAFSSRFSACPLEESRRRFDSSENHGTCQIGRFHRHTTMRWFKRVTLPAFFAIYVWMHSMNTPASEVGRLGRLCRSVLSLLSLAVALPIAKSEGHSHWQLHASSSAILRLSMLGSQDRNLNDICLEYTYEELKQAAPCAQQI